MDIKTKLGTEKFMAKHYLYTCYCGPQKTRLQSERGGGGYIYENCPALTAPKINNTLDDLVDHRVKKIKLNIHNIIDIFKSYGCTKAHLIGSFVQNQTKSSSDIDFAADIPVLDRNIIGQINDKLTSLLENQVDVVPYFFLEGFPHSALEKASILIFDDNISK